MILNGSYVAILAQRSFGADPYVCMCRLGCHVCATPTEESSSYLGCAGQVVSWVVFMNGKVLTPLDSWDLFTWYLA